jgi:uncharacterized membrane protein (UPF0127 family)
MDAGKREFCRCSGLKPSGVISHSKDARAKMFDISEMLFSFDVVMIDKNFRVVTVKELVKPFRVILPKLRAESVIDLPAHTIFCSRTEVGDELVIDRYEARNIPKPVGAANADQVVSGSRQGIQV